MPSVDEILAGSPLAGLRRVSPGGGDRQVASVRLAESFADLDQAPGGSLVVLSRATSAGATDYRLDMALRWASIHQVAGVAAFSAGPWQPAVTAMDIAERAGIALIWIPAGADLAALMHAIHREIGGSAERALGRAQQGLDAVAEAEQAGADLERLRAQVSRALGTPVEFRPAAADGSPVVNGQRGVAAAASPESERRGRSAAATQGAGRSAAATQGAGRTAAATQGAGAQPGAQRQVSVPVVIGDTLAGYFEAPQAHGDLGIAARLVLHAAASAAARLLDLARRAREVPARSRSELLAELLMSESALNEDLLDRARQLGIPVGGWHVAVRIEAEEEDDSERDEVQRFELLEQAGQLALEAAAATGGTWYSSRMTRGIVLTRVTSSNPGPQAGTRVARSAERSLHAVRARWPSVRFRAGVGAPHEGPVGLRASAAEARGALLAARAARKPPGVATHDAVGVQRMLMEWYTSDTARASVRDQLAPLEKLGSARAETAIRTLAAYLDEQGSIVKTAQKLHLHRNAVANRLRGITELLGIDLDDPDQRLALQLACRARLLE